MKGMGSIMILQTHVLLHVFHDGTNVVFIISSIEHYENLANFLVFVFRAVVVGKHHIIFSFLLESIKNAKNVYRFTFI